MSSSSPSKVSGNRRDREEQAAASNTNKQTTTGSSSSTSSSSQQQQKPQNSAAAPSSHNNNNNLMSPAILVSERIGLKAESCAPPIVTIALTGGPCAGKSTSLVAISTEVQKRTNFKVFCVPEAATLLVAGGLEWKDMNNERTIEYQLALLRTQLALEDNLKAVARACGQPALILCDRGTMDGRSYCSPEQWAEICRRGGFQTESLRDQRYDAILHLVTAAIGAEGHYNLDNNPARYEDVEGARDADVRLRQMYVGHPRIKLIHNKPDETFQQKVNAAVDFVFQCIGHTPPLHDKRRFLLKWNENRSVPVQHETVQVTSSILADSTPSSYSVAMLRKSKEVCTRVYLVVNNDDHSSTPNSAPPKEGARMQQQMYLTEKEYSLLVDQMHKGHVELVKKNHVFTIDGVFYDLAVHQAPSWTVGYATLYVDGLEKNAKLPDFLNDAVETTGTCEMSSFHMSQTVLQDEIKEKMAAFFK